ncbi:MAG: zinc-dependent metalloprotease, partial [Bdellovibrio sp.]
MRSKLFQINFSVISVFFIFTITSGCTGSHDNKKNLALQRQAPEKIDKSIQVPSLTNNNQSANSIILLKENLGKAFMLMPVMTSTGRNPDETMLSPRIISFEKSGDRIALFNLSAPQLYENMRSERLLQTFPIIEENENSFVVNIGQGFTSLDSNSNMGVLLRGALDELKKQIQSGNENSLDVKDSFVRNIVARDNSIIIEQVVRIKTTSIEEKTNPLEVPANQNQKSMPALVTKENTSTFVFEIKPYRPSPSFHSKIFDKEQRIGYFLNFALEKQQDEIIPQITKWDIAQERGPIKVHLSSATPLPVRESMTEGILYWNKVFGGNVFEVSKDFDKQDYQEDRSIHVYWIPWDSAGFARAAFQADPLTGEILRAQVFMTSSWYRMTQEEFKPLDGDSQELSQNTDLGKCILDQKQLLDLNFIAELNGKPWSEKAALDTVRIVLAHEIGHTLGLRHNFAGSFTAPARDSEMAQFRQDYIEDKRQDRALTSSTVMDYTAGLDTAINGNYIKNRVMPYDSAAISWGYLDKDISLDKYNYCSDEHIMLAAQNKKVVFNCDRFDKNHNVVTAKIEALTSQTKYKSFEVFSTFLQALKQNQSSFNKNQSFEQILGTISFSRFDMYNFDSYLYDKQYSESFVSVPNIIEATLPSLSGTSLNADSSMNDLLRAQSKEAGGYAEMLKAVLDVRGGDVNFYEKQVNGFLKNINPDNFKDQLSLDQFNKLKTKMITEAQAADKVFEDILIRDLAPIKLTFDMDSSGVYKPIERKINPSFSLGDPQVFLNVFFPAYERSLTKSVKQYELNG